MTTQLDSLFWLLSKGKELLNVLGGEGARRGAARASLGGILMVMNLVERQCQMPEYTMRSMCLRIHARNWELTAKD